MALATLSIDIEAKLANLEQGMDKASRLVEKNSKQIESSFASIRNAGAALGGVLSGAFAALGAAGLANMFVSVNAGVNALKDLKEATGASIENISGLEDVAARTGTNFETVGSALIKFNKALTDAGRTPEVAAVLKGLGLDAEKLKQIDPAEALRQTAVALAGFADDGNKARAAQELFGKSLKDVAPFLANLAEQGKLNATITTEQALAAEKFNNELESLKKNSLDNARAITTELVPALNRFFDALNGNRKGGGFFASISQELQANVISDKLRVVTDEIVRLDAYMQKNPGNQKLQQAMAGLRAEAALLSAQALKASDALKGFSDVAKPFQDAANFSNEGRNSKKPSLNVPVAPKGGAAKTSELDKYIDRLEAAQIAALDLSAVEQAQIDIVSGKLGKLTKAQEGQVLSLAKGLDALKAFDLVGPTIDPQLLKDRVEAQRELNKLLEASDVGKLDSLLSVEETLNAAFREGSITAAQFNSALDALEKKFDDIAPIAEEAAGKIDEFTAQAARNIQDALGESVLSSLKGDFSSIGQLWADLLRKMLAQAVAARLGNALFGDFGNTGEIGGLFGQAIGLFTGAGGGGGESALVGAVGSAVPQLLDGGGGRSSALGFGRGGSSAGLTLNQTVNVGQGVSRGEVAVAVNEGNRALMSQLQAAGRI